MDVIHGCNPLYTHNGKVECCWVFRNTVEWCTGSGENRNTFPCDRPSVKKREKKKRLQREFFHFQE